MQCDLQAKDRLKCVFQSEPTTDFSINWEKSSSSNIKSNSSSGQICLHEQYIQIFATRRQKQACSAAAASGEVTCEVTCERCVLTDRHRGSGVGVPFPLHPKTNSSTHVCLKPKPQITFTVCVEKVLVTVNKAGPFAAGLQDANCSLKVGLAPRPACIQHYAHSLGIRGSVCCEPTSEK